MPKRENSWFCSCFLTDIVALLCNSTYLYATLSAWRYYVISINILSSDVFLWTLRSVTVSSSCNALSEGTSLYFLEILICTKKTAEDLNTFLTLGSDGNVGEM